MKIKAPKEDKTAKAPRPDYRLPNYSAEAEAIMARATGVRSAPMPAAAKAPVAAVDAE